jgi:hypothetical protein
MPSVTRLKPRFTKAQLTTAQEIRYWAGRSLAVTTLANVTRAGLSNRQRRRSGIRLERAWFLLLGPAPFRTWLGTVTMTFYMRPGSQTGRQERTTRIPWKIRENGQNNSALAPNV